MKNRFVIMLPFSLLVVTACTAEHASSPENTGSEAQREAWTPDDDPALFNANLERRASALPKRGEAANIPWAGSYWPMYADGINHRWNGANSLSPAKKYELAFHRSGVEDAISRHSGIDAHADQTSCTRDSQCNADLSEVCGKRAGQNRGRCIPSWFGICHAWAPAAILVPEPQHDVVKNGVTFHVQDIKALVSLVHEAVTTKFVSLRCNVREGEMERDENGRPVSECRDTNAGTLHILLANYLGLKKQSFVEDRTYSDEVWNQPLRGYEVLEDQEISAREANRLILENTESAPSRYRFNPDAVSFRHVRTKVQYINESSPRDGNVSSRIDDFTGSSEYDYVLEIDANGAIIGGEWVGDSKNDHPDFLWLPIRANRRAIIAGGNVSYDEVKELADASVAP